LETENFQRKKTFPAPNQRDLGRKNGKKETRKRGENLGVPHNSIKREGDRLRTPVENYIQTKMGNRGKEKEKNGKITHRKKKNGTIRGGLYRGGNYTRKTRKGGVGRGD